jgi:hypothetical protein
MLLQFKVVKDGSLWAIDTDKLRYYRLARPLLEIAENPKDEPAIEEFGELKSVHPIMELYRLEGRTPNTDGPGCGLTSVAIITRITDQTLEIGVNANVEISEPVCVKSIDTVRCEVLGQSKTMVH